MNENIRNILSNIGEYKIKGQEIIPSVCPFCQGGSHRDKETFAINLETGAYNCKRGTCGSSGSIKQLCEHFGAGYKQPELFREYRKPKKVYKLPEVRTDGLTKEIIDYFAKRMISEETLIKNKVTTYNGNIAFNFYEDGKLVMIKYKIPRKPQIVNGKKENKSWREPGGKPVLYGMDDCIPGYPLIIVEGEPDKLVLDECGIKNALSVPSGTQDLEWIDLCWEWMQLYQEIIIYVDSDVAGMGLQQDLIARLDEWKLRLVTSEYKDANEVLYKRGKQAVIDLIANARTIDKEYIIDLANVKRKDYRTQYVVSTGYDALDKLLGGMYGGMLCVWSGYNGGGKSTMLSNIMLNGANQRIKAFIYSGELSKDEFKEWMDLQASGPNYLTSYECPIKRDRLPMTKPEYHELLDDFYRETLYLFDSDDYATDTAILSAMEYMAKREGVKVFMLDNLMALDYTEKGELNERQARLVKRLKSFARKFNAIVHLVAHPRKPALGQHRMTKYDVSGTSNITDLADRVFGFHRLHKSELEKIELGYEGYNNVLMIFKDRKYGVVDEELKFKFDFFSKRYYATPKEKEREYYWTDKIKDKPEINTPWTQLSTEDPF